MASRLFATALASTARRTAPAAIRGLATRSGASLVASRQPVLSLPITKLSPRFYSAAAGLSKEDITARIIDVLKSFEKVDAAKLTPTSSFAEDLGLDSLDAVEVVMAVEEEFAIEIPDAEADEIKTVSHAIEYISKTPEAH
ncbi:hypothetical protein FRB94_014509 [Tulasnella sp. JGI-2019a]|nr:hypothetical protein FRB94_014509 [Tulasnella sp. JGI-2019a]KAG9011667.1 hypothetical protein FRB93_002728 [Tulasnella sp. JGI-2019a]KAG9038765.1 hypothetical protein FRB95_014314 [Tulasnella sp. JGI-2019a]